MIERTQIDDADFSVARTYICPAVFPPIVVAIPAKDEAEEIAACLRAIAAQVGGRGATLIGQVGVVCLINDSRDDTFDIACAEAARAGLLIRVYDVAMAPHAANAGGARRASMDLAAAWLEEGHHEIGQIFTTDADSIPAPDWVAAARKSFARGAHGVAGPIDLHPRDAAALPAHVRARGALEARYEALLTEMFARLDPRPHDPWPRHAAEPGANLAVTLRAYCAIGGLPPVACGEDRALCAALENHGLRLRHDPAVRVSTSGRLSGRAIGGVADTIRLRCVEPEADCDPYLEPAWNARFRAFWRGRLRAAFANGGASAAARAFNSASTSSESTSFGLFWSELEKSEACLQRRLLRPVDLPRSDPGC